MLDQYKERELEEIDCENLVGKGREIKTQDFVKYIMGPGQVFHILLSRTQDGSGGIGKLQQGGNLSQIPGSLVLPV